MPIPTISPKLIALLGGLTAILLFFQKIKEMVIAIGAWVRRRTSRQNDSFRVDLRITPGFRLHNFWQEASMNGKPFMLVICRLSVSNVGRTDTFQILDAYIEKPKTPLMIPPDLRQVYGGRLAHLITLHFGVNPPVRKPGEKFKVNIVLVDQFSRPHKIKGLSFSHMGGPGWDILKQQLEAEATKPK